MAKYNLIWEEKPQKTTVAPEKEKPEVTLLPLSIKLNAAAASTLSSSENGAPDKVVLAYDHDKKVIAVKAYDGTPNLKAYEFKEKLTENGVLIRCKSFMNSVRTSMNIELSKAQLTCPAHYSGRAKMLIAEVSPNPVSEIEA